MYERECVCVVSMCRILKIKRVGEFERLTYITRSGLFVVQSKETLSTERVAGDMFVSCVTTELLSRLVKKCFQDFFLYEDFWEMFDLTILWTPDNIWLHNPRTQLRH